MMYKQYLIVTADAIKNMKGNRGRMINQGGHGWIHSMWDAMDRFPEAVKAYREQKSAFKITLVVETAEELRALYEVYKDKCGITLVEEKGSRQNGEVNEEVKGVTCLGIGPIHADHVGDDLNSLKPFL